MSRVRPENRIDQLADTAATVFTRRGYRRTQMAEVARAMGVAPGTLYLYVQSKEALFDLVIQRAFRAADAPPPPPLPIETPAAGATLRHLRERFASEARMPVLAAAVKRRRATDVRAELEAIVREQYAFVSAQRRGIALLERSALDWPELAALFYTDLRGGLLRQLTTYLEHRMRQRQLRRVPHPAASARFIVETVAWFAMHRHGDADAAVIDDAMAEATVVDALINTFVKE